MTKTLFRDRMNRKNNNNSLLFIIVLQYFIDTFKHPYKGWILKLHSQYHILTLYDNHMIICVLIE